MIKEDVRVGKSNKLKWCARPGCENTVRRPGCCKRRAICNSCGFETCFKCGDPYHEENCQVTGNAQQIFHNMNPMVSKCPNCRILIYKTDGCHHMTCRRCNKEWCWICRRVLGSNYSKHYKPGALFGCAGMMQIGESKILFVFLLTL